MSRGEARDGPTRRRRDATPTVSRVLGDGSLVEMVLSPDGKESGLIEYRDGEWRREEGIAASETERLVPYRPENNLLRHGVVLLPSEPAEYGSTAELLAEVRAFIHRYVDLSPLFEEIAAHYVLFTWIFDAFNELPYLRVRGDYGSGKSRFLLIVGSVSYKPIFASGASTVSPLFRIMDAFRGTLVVDEGDFRFSDETAEVIKILNNGNARGFPVLRSEVTPKKEFDPRAFEVFGPKLIATRGFFADRALESRCLTEEMGMGPLREEIPLNLPARYREEARELRNKLLLFRFRNFAPDRELGRAADSGIAPRLAQVFAPLLATIEDPEAKGRLMRLARRYQREAVEDAGLTLEAEVLECVRDLATGEGEPSLKDVASLFADRHGEELARPVTPKWVGFLLRRKLQLRPERRRGVYVLPGTELAKLPRLLEKYGIAAADSGPAFEGGDLGDFGDVAGGARGGEPPEAPGAAEAHETAYDAPPEGREKSPKSPTSPA